MSEKNNEMKVNTPSGSKLLTVVPPVLQEVGKLAAGVASVSTGSATGNPRNKVALKPGHSLMDWIRLGVSGKDLTGVGNLAGKLKITLEQLATHNSEDDAWIAINGHVFNVTDYLNFHPGGRELMLQYSGKDGTKMFNEVHPWVNYEQILSKCLVGELSAVADADSFAFHVRRKSLIPTPLVDHKELSFDWMQKRESVNLLFFTGVLNNPYVEIHPINKEGKYIIQLAFNKQQFICKFKLYQKVLWPPIFKINYETGKIDILLKKATDGIWPVVGEHEIEMRKVSSDDFMFHNYKMLLKKKLTPTVWLMSLERENGILINSAICKHVSVYYDDAVRFYTLVPDSTFDAFDRKHHDSSNITLLFRVIENGKVSPFLGDLKRNNSVKISVPIGQFDIKVIENKTNFFFITGGTGLSSVLSLITFLLERKIKPCKQIFLLTCSKFENEIIMKKELISLAERDARFKVEFIVTRSENYTGLKTYIDLTMMLNLISKHFDKSMKMSEDIYFAYSGPSHFIESVGEVIKEKLNIKQDNYFSFRAT